MTISRTGSPRAELPAFLRNAIANVRAIRETVRRETRPHPEEAELSLTKARLSGSNLDEGMRTMPVAALVLCATYAIWHPLWLIALWLGAYIVVWSLHWTINRTLAKATPETARAALGYYRLQNILFVAVWGSQAWLFWIPGDPVNHMVVAAVILASTIGAVMSAAWAPTAITQIVGYLGSVFLLFAIEGGAVNYMLAGLALVFAMFVGTTCAHMHKTTERMLLLEGDKDRLIENLRASDRAKSDFLANMSHELRTPLNAILGFSEVMKDEIMGAIGNAHYKTYAGDIHVSGLHLLGLINDILDLSKIEAGKFELHDDLFTLEEIVDTAFMLMRFHAERGQVALVKEVSPEIAVRWDLRSAKQIAFNLMSNAIKFTPAGGTVRVVARATPDGGAFISVIDNGSGIAAADQKKVFEPFGQGRHDLAMEEKSTGLGLAIVKGLVELHGGRLELTSEVGRGSDFTIIVPPERVLSAADVQQAA